MYVCLTKLDLIELECQHGICLSCGQQWFIKSSACPICKRDLSRDSLSEDFNINLEQETSLSREIGEEYDREFQDRIAQFERDMHNSTLIIPIDINGRSINIGTSPSMRDMGQLIGHSIVNRILEHLRNDLISEQNLTPTLTPISSNTPSIDWIIANMMVATNEQDMINIISQAMTSSTYFIVDRFIIVEAFLEWALLHSSIITHDRVQDIITSILTNNFATIY